jgi:hypothetical protein
MEQKKRKVGSGRPGQKRSSTKRTYEPRIASAMKVWRDNHYKDKDLPFDIFLKMSQEPCYYCGTIQYSSKNVFADDRTRGVMVSNFGVEHGNFKYNGIDKLDYDKGYVIENIVTCCRICNFLKQRLSQKDFLNQIQKIAEHRLHLSSGFAKRLCKCHATEEITATK